MLGVGSNSNEKTSMEASSKVYAKHVHRGFKIPMCIDGIRMKKTVKKIVISRLMKSDGVT